MINDLIKGFEGHYVEAFTPGSITSSRLSRSHQNFPSLGLRKISKKDPEELAQF
jgi:hypothetical protein